MYTAESKGTGQERPHRERTTTDYGLRRYHSQTVILRKSVIPDLQSTISSVSEQRPHDFDFDLAVIDRRSQDVHQLHTLIVGQLPE